ncbi:hypothetical protein OIV19_23355 [Brucella sp. HL-2]|nr:hypothetical protein [Brucella sp. HL-2]MCV9910488.1 hypothetical protein [Brucella sp. HL-2]
MLKNGKLFLPPSRAESDFKEVFRRLAAAGAGRPIGRDGFPVGPWTPELLAEAISQIDSNRIGVDLRTVQLWFQENDKGISATNIRWLARVFGCDDPVSTSEWQIELSAAQSRLAAKRRDYKTASISVTSALPAFAHTTTRDAEPANSIGPTDLTDAGGVQLHFSLSRQSAELFSHRSPLNLPASVFAGFAALGFLSYISGIHDVTYGRADGVVKQVGFLWTANWTFVFMAFLPLFFVFVSEQVTFWKEERRLWFKARGDRFESDQAWARSVDASSYAYWAVFVICVLFAGLFQWVGVSLIPLINGSGNYATDWGTIAIVRPEVVSVPEAVVFTGFAYLYMCLCYYLFCAGLILLYTVVHDFWSIDETPGNPRENAYQTEGNKVCLRVMCGIFRCTLLGVLIAIAMKLQSAYLTSRGENIVKWLISDLSSAFYWHNDVKAGISFRRPTHYSSLLVVISTGVVFLYGCIRLGGRYRVHLPLWRMSAVVGLLMIGYLLIDAFAGFSILLAIGWLLAIYGLIDPDFRRWRAGELGDNQSVS